MRRSIYDGRSATAAAGTKVSFISWSMIMASRWAVRPRPAEATDRARQGRDDPGRRLRRPDHLLPTSWETPTFELHETVTPSPHHPIGAKGVGESATVGSPAAVNG